MHTCIHRYIHRYIHTCVSTCMYLCIHDVTFSFVYCEPRREENKLEEAFGCVTSLAKVLQELRFGAPNKSFQICWESLTGRPRACSISCVLGALRCGISRCLLNPPILTVFLHFNGSMPTLSARRDFVELP